MGDEGISRRGLFRFGLGRALRELDDGSDQRMREPSAPAPPAVPLDDPAMRGRLDRLREGREHGEGSVLWPEVAPALVEAAIVTPAETILDAGCGDGAVARACAARGARVTGIDDSPALLERARELAEEELDPDGAPAMFREGDVAALPFADETFDSALSALHPMFCLRTEAAVSELLRVTRPEGIVGLAVWASGGVVARLLREAIRQDPLPMGLREPLYWGREEALRELLEPHTLSIESRLHQQVWDFADRDEAVRRLIAGFAPLAVAHDRTPLDEVVGDIVDQLGGIGDGPVRLEAHFLVVVAERS